MIGNVTPFTLDRAMLKCISQEIYSPIYVLVCPYHMVYSKELDPFQYKDRPFRYGDSHYKDNAVTRLSYFYYGKPCVGKTVSVYWDGPLVVSDKIVQ